MRERKNRTFFFKHPPFGENGHFRPKSAFLSEVREAAEAFRFGFFPGGH
ncbi:MAG: hypothetical protein MRZ54_12250 [Clostridiales bacterium]|nr:hypothetical protein [Clostridiales bacterium]